jgi:hypothetical protein
VFPVEFLGKTIHHGVDVSGVVHVPVDVDVLVPDFLFEDLLDSRCVRKFFGKIVKHAFSWLRIFRVARKTDSTV